MQRLFIAMVAHNIVSSHVTMASIQTGPDRSNWSQAFDKFRHLLKAAAKREFRPRCVFNQDAEIGISKVESPSSFHNGLCAQHQADLACEASPRARMQDQVFRFEGQSALNFATKSCNRLSPYVFGLAAKVHQVTSMYNHRRAVVFVPKLMQLSGMGSIDACRTPCSRAG